MKKWASALVSTLICLVGLECAVRALGLAPGINRIEIHGSYGHFIQSGNPILKYVPKPGSLDINEFGIRDLPFEVGKADGSYRILVLGDSIGFGLCNGKTVLPIEKLFSRVLERRLNARVAADEMRYQVLNLSVSGYNTAQEVEFLVEKGLDLDPDLVVLAYCLNDAFEVSAESDSLERNPDAALVAAAQRYLILQSHVARLIWQHTRAEHETLTAETGEQMDRHPVADHFARLAQLSQAHEFQTLLVIFPLFFDYSQEDWTEAIGWFNRRSWPREHQTIRALGEANGFSVLDLFGAFEEADPGEHRRLQGRCTGSHPNATGHAIAAQEIERHLVNWGVVLEAR